MRLSFISIAMSRTFQALRAAPVRDAYMHTTGPQPGVTAAFERALKIADQLGNAAAQWRALCGLRMAPVAAGQYASAVELSRRARHAALNLGDEAVIMSERLLTVSQHFVGNQAIARRHAENVFSQDIATGSRFSNDDYQLPHSLLAEILWLQGFPDRALQTAHEAVAEALAADHALSLRFALFCACPTALWAGDLPAVSRFAAMLLDHSERCSLPYWHFWGRCFEAAVKLRLDEPTGPGETCLDLLRDPLFSTVHLELLTACCEKPFAAEAIARAESGIASWCRRELLRIEADAILRDARSGADGTAEDLLRRSLDAAREQGAPSRELRTATSLARE
jgi:hypothetical protein